MLNPILSSWYKNNFKSNTHIFI
ncbi:protein of unknown function [Enterobacter cancerogenus]|nr:protein of unknown function [Enterobacter cancerogenus]